MDNCIFCKIATKQITKELTYEDSEVMVFPDIHPIKPVHLLIVPKEHIPTFLELENNNLIQKIHKIIKDMVVQHGLDDKGYRIVINGGGAQAIDHLHFHLTGPWGMRTKDI
jgi:histidine triad (HIT) family protein